MLHHVFQTVQNAGLHERAWEWDEIGVEVKGDHPEAPHVTRGARGSPVVSLGGDEVRRPSGLVLELLAGPQRDPKVCQVDCVAEPRVGEPHWLDELEEPLWTVPVGPFLFPLSLVPDSLGLAEVALCRAQSLDQIFAIRLDTP